MSEVKENAYDGSKGGKARMGNLTPEQRSEFAKAGAKKRWAKAVPEPAPAPRKAAPKKKRSGNVFGAASLHAEKRLGIAIKERAECMSKLAMLQAEIPSLVQIIKALGGTVNPAALPSMTLAMPTGAAYGIEQVISNAPVPARPVPIVAPVMDMESPHPATPSRAMGGAVAGIDLDPEFPADEDEDVFLRDSGVGGGTWHG